MLLHIYNNKIIYSYLILMDILKFKILPISPIYNIFIHLIHQLSNSLLLKDNLGLNIAKLISSIKLSHLSTNTNHSNQLDSPQIILIYKISNH
jgi:hypothetical protein